MRLRRLVQFTGIPRLLRSVFVLSVGLEGEPFVPPEEFHGRNREGCPGGFCPSFVSSSNHDLPHEYVYANRRYTRIYILPYPLPFRSPGLPSRTGAEPGRIGTNGGASTPPAALHSRCFHHPTTHVISRSVGLQMHPRWLPYTPGMTDELQQRSSCVIGVYRTFQLRARRPDSPLSLFLSVSLPPLPFSIFRVFLGVSSVYGDKRETSRCAGWRATETETRVADDEAKEKRLGSVCRKPRAGKSRHWNLLCPPANCPLDRICYKHGKWKKEGTRRDASG